MVAILSRHVSLAFHAYRFRLVSLLWIVLVLIDMFTNDSFETLREKKVSGVCQIYDKV